MTSEGARGVDDGISPFPNPRCRAEQILCSRYRASIGTVIPGAREEGLCGPEVSWTLLADQQSKLGTSLLSLFVISSHASSSRVGCGHLGGDSRVVLTVESSRELRRVGPRVRCYLNRNVADRTVLTSSQQVCVVLQRFCAKYGIPCTILHLNGLVHEIMLCGEDRKVSLSHLRTPPVPPQQHCCYTSPLLTSSLLLFLVLLLVPCALDPMCTCLAIMFVTPWIYTWYYMELMRDILRCRLEEQRCITLPLSWCSS